MERPSLSSSGVPGDRNAVPGAVRGFRKKVQRLLLPERKLECGLFDVIENDRRTGYRLSEKIEAHDHDREEPSDRVVGQREPMSRTEPTNEPNDEPLNKRQTWALRRRAAGRKLRRRDIERKFGVSSATAKRDLQALLGAGRIELVGGGKTVFYRLWAQG